jgi:HD-like signal output (HDOD) protein
MEVIRLCRDENATANDIGRVLSQDPALTAKILKLANSPFFGFRSEVTTVSHAVVMLGMVSVRTIALGFSLFRGLSSGASTGSPSFDHRAYWSHSLIAATAARELAAELQLANSEEAFLCGLLQNLGCLVMSESLPDEQESILASAERHVDTLDLEREVLETTHAEIGSMLAVQWNFPATLTASILWHHEPEAADASVQEIVRMVSTADYIAEAWVTAHRKDAIQDARRQAHAFWGIDDDGFSKIMERVTDALPEVSRLFELDITRDEDLAEVQQTATDLLLEVPLAVLIDAADGYDVDRCVEGENSRGVA